MEGKEVFNLDKQWELYLKRVGLKGKRIPVSQYNEMKQTFFGACGQILMLITHELAELPDDQALKQLDSMINQVGNHFLKATNRNN